MDTDLFQTLAIVLLAVITALLFLTYLALARVRRVLQERPAPASFEQPGPATFAAAAAGASPSPSAEEKEPEEERELVDAAAAEAPEPITAAAADEPAPDEATGPASIEEERAPALAADEGRAEQETPAVAEQAPEEEQERPGGEEAELVGAVAAGQGEAPAEESTTSYEGAVADTGYEGYEDEPQEQPFERDGRWWFRRGDELLVYDEQTGQWMPAPSRTAGGPATAELSGGGTAVATETRTTSYSESLSGRAETRASESAGGFWKCQSCGAVNGSTATSCRMCFSPRP